MKYPMTSSETIFFSTVNNFFAYTVSGVTQEPDAPEVDLSTATEHLDIKTRKELRDLCWETMFGQELVKLTVMDLVSIRSNIHSLNEFRSLEENWIFWTPKKEYSPKAARDGKVETILQVKLVN